MSDQEELRMFLWCCVIALAYGAGCGALLHHLPVRTDAMDTAHWYNDDMSKAPEPLRPR